MQEQAATLARSVEDPQLLGMALNHLGELHLQQERCRSRRTHLEQALSYYEEHWQPRRCGAERLEPG